MKRGQVWWVQFDPVIRGEIKKSRPAIIVSNDTFNQLLNRVQVVPLTSQIKKVYPGESVFSLKNKKVKFLPSQIRTVAKERLYKLIDEISIDTMIEVEKGIKIQLNLI